MTSLSFRNNAGSSEEKIPSFYPTVLDICHSFHLSIAVSTWLNIIINFNKIFYWLYEKVFYFALFLLQMQTFDLHNFPFLWKNPINTPDKSDVLTENDHSAFAFRFAERIFQIQHSKLNLAPRPCFTQIFEYFMFSSFFFGSGTNRSPMRLCSCSSNRKMIFFSLTSVLEFSLYFWSLDELSLSIVFCGFNIATKEWGPVSGISLRTRPYQYCFKYLFYVFFSFLLVSQTFLCFIILQFVKIMAMWL